jgi:hypothetical protein
MIAESSEQIVSLWLFQGSVYDYFWNTLRAAETIGVTESGFRLPDSSVVYLYPNDYLIRLYGDGQEVRTQPLHQEIVTAPSHDEAESMAFLMLVEKSPDGGTWRVFGHNNMWTSGCLDG